MYITITPQKLGSHYLQSAGDFVDYLEKENQGKTQNEMEAFFDPYDDKISAEEVESIRSQVAEHGKYEPLFIATIYGEKGEVVAEVEKKLWVKKK